MNLIFIVFLELISCTHLVLGSVSSCVHGGTKYQDGDYFLSNKTFIKTENSMQCVQCRCHQGLVVCEVENCLTLNCEKPIKFSKYCCLQCPGEKKIPQKSFDFVINREGEYGSFNKEPTNDCLLNGLTYANGSTWQPVIGPFGAMACVQCQCLEGSVVCARLKCNNQSCTHPVREFGECCPVCPTSEIKNEIQVFCLPKASEYFVFKASTSQNDSKTIIYAFLENNTESEYFKLYIWDLKLESTLNSLTVKILNKKEVYTKNFKLLGSVSQKRFKKFSQRIQRIRKNCYDQCFKKIKRLETSLGIYPAIAKSACAQNEMSVPVN